MRIVVSEKGIAIQVEDKGAGIDADEQEQSDV
jgi:hypothetical protein